MGSLGEAMKGGITVEGWAATDNSGMLSPFQYKLREPKQDDVVIKVLYCGLCHTDLHQARNDYGKTLYPIVPGHEVVGVVSEVGEKVEKFEKGDAVGVGCIVGCCGHCDACMGEMEQYCNKRIWTYNDTDCDGIPTYGGFATTMVVNHKFVVKMPKKLRLDSAGPLLCAGITVYSPMKFYGMTEAGKKCGVVGLGGVGHMAVKFAKAFGLHVTVVSTSPSKEKEALGVLGADAFLVSSDEEKMKAANQTLDYIMDTVPIAHPLEPYLSLLKINGKLVLLGVSPTPLQFKPPLLLLGRRSIGGSFIGGMKEVEEMLEFAVEKGVECVAEVINIDSINVAMDRLHRNDVKYRFVVDMTSTAQLRPPLHVPQHSHVTSTSPTP